jgi:hypothetical protein
MVALAERAIACKGWRWMPGMLADGGLRLTDTYPLYLENGVPRFPVSDEHTWGLYLRESEDNPAILPDLTDPATLGCLLALVRSAYVDPWIRVEPMSSGWACIYSRPPPGLPANGDTEAEALVAALECAP